MPKVLHITTHMGGGIGKFLSETLIYEKTHRSPFEHKIILLEQPKKKQFVEICENNGIDVLIKDQNTNFYDDFKEADLVVLHWWHNPVMSGFLRKFPPIEIGLVLWVHVSGCTYPSFPAELALLPHKTVFTTAFSYDNSAWSSEERNKIKEQSTVLFGLGVNAVSHKPVTLRSSGEEFRIGYVGTLSESKIHPEFALFCKAVLKEIPSSRFILVGDLNGNEKIFRDIQDYGIAERFEFVGYTDRVDEQLETLDVFGYPLNPYHFGTTENVVLEAMSIGLPVVMLNQCTEKYIVTHKTDGLLANNAEEYVKLMRYLYYSPDERVRIGENAKETVLNKYSIKRNVEGMRKVFYNEISRPKRLFDFNSIFGIEPYEWFLSCLGEDKKMFCDSLDQGLMTNRNRKTEIIDAIQNCRPILRGQGKSSVLQFAETYPNDNVLSFWRGMVQSQ
ncbi:glycosyl transferase group 1 [Syntrophobotulus glycolicus DSM 8271]|uniref:Glycosyl transferase group 1 n=1 Tax=Syntrophobotulus glycolicus (strain DSM 8271 / FlGlyR) TaxID=645991 RepID=F0SZD2_SYNGF|nr:glycosyltransferase family 4 protein [Syntrophobotulus glycolicus]ADY54937.1 glycosyl transferase group 1 [Syntrophobotulus glycolicus DSM 8271]